MSAAQMLLCWSSMVKRNRLASTETSGLLERRSGLGEDQRSPVGRPFRVALLAGRAGDELHRTAVEWLHLDVAGPAAPRVIRQQPPVGRERRYEYIERLVHETLVGAAVAGHPVQIRP